MSNYGHDMVFIISGYINQASKVLWRFVMKASLEKKIVISITSNILLKISIEPWTPDFQFKFQ